jgi:hypothetical protein
VAVQMPRLLSEPEMLDVSIEVTVGVVTRRLRTPTITFKQGLTVHDSDRWCLWRYGDDHIGPIMIMSEERTLPMAELDLEGDDLEIALNKSSLFDFPFSPVDGDILEVVLNDSALLEPDYNYAPVKKLRFQYNDKESNTDDELHWRTIPAEEMFSQSWRPIAVGNVEISWAK